MLKLSYAAILMIFIIAVMLVLNTALLHLLYGIDPADQLEALTSLAVAGCFPGEEAPVSGEGGGQRDKGAGQQGKGTGRQDKGGGKPAGSGITNTAVGMNASRSGEKTGANSQNNPAGQDSQPGEPGAAGTNCITGEDFFITLEEIGLLENMSLQDKLKAASILSGIDRNVLDSAIQMAADGITYDEYNELLDSADEYLDQTDIETLEDILNRNRSLYAHGGR